LRSIADGVIFHFLFAGRVGEVMPIVVIHAELPETLRTEAKHRENIVRPKKEKRIIGSQKIVVDTV